jgi:3-oxoacyl-[acyl-carrier protein] reductase
MHRPARPVSLARVANGLPAKPATGKERSVQALAGKVAVVTGASRGIGRATAERLARQGAAVVVNYAVSAEEADAVVAAIEAEGGHAIAVQADMARLDDIRRLFETAVGQLGRLDILVANAGYSVFKALTRTTEEDFDRMYAVNAKGTFFCLQEALRHMVKGGRIVCVSTIGTSLNPPGGSCYLGSKAAIEQFCGVLGKEVAGRGITVNVVSPGFVDTKMLRDLFADSDLAQEEKILEMIPLARLGQPEDIAETIVFLAGDEGRWITRQNIAVDGGVVSR